VAYYWTCSNNAPVPRPGSALTPGYETGFINVGNRVKEIVCNAITNRRLLSFTYEGFERVVEPHLCGQNDARHDVLLGWMVRGHSNSDPRPGWRNYLLTAMRNVQILDETFDQPRPGFKPVDSRMTTVYCRLEVPS